MSVADNPPTDSQPLSEEQRILQRAEQARRQQFKQSIAKLPADVKEAAYAAFEASSNAHRERLKDEIKQYKQDSGDRQSKAADVIVAQERSALAEQQKVEQKAKRKSKSAQADDNTPTVDVAKRRETGPFVVEVQDLWKRYHGPFGGDWVLRGLNFKIPYGVSVGIVGRNGAGKSTLLKLIAGMDSPDRGKVLENARISWPIGLSGGLQGSMTGRQNTKFVARIHGGGDDIDDIIERVQKFAEIGSAFDQPISTYSTGMRSRLNFGLSLAFDFDVYISDEATAVGDVTFKEKARNAFRERVGNASLIMVSHQTGILRDLCQAGIFLHEGQAIWYDSIDDAIDAYYASIGRTPDKKS